MQGHGTHDTIKPGQAGDILSDTPFAGFDGRDAFFFQFPAKHHEHVLRRIHGNNFFDMRVQIERDITGTGPIIEDDISTFRTRNPDHRVGNGSCHIQSVGIIVPDDCSLFKVFRHRHVSPQGRLMYRVMGNYSL